MGRIGVQMAKSKAVAATASNVGTTIDMTGANGLMITNTSATLYVCVAWGTSAPTAVLDTYPAIPPMSYITVGANDLITHVSAIGSGAGPTKVVFTPLYDV